MMHTNYSDILKRIPEQPAWYDSNGTPRYDKFEPDLCPNIYADHVGLFLIACQDCGRQFRVEMHADIFGGYRLNYPPSKWHYGDPPIHGCVGDSMNCEDLAVLEFWSRKKLDWKRQKRFEGVIDELPDQPSPDSSQAAGGNEPA